MTPVLDSGALLALLNREPGCDRVEELLDQAVMSTINVAEVATVLARRGQHNLETIVHGVVNVGVRIVPYLYIDAVKTGAFWDRTKHAGLSLGDRACLAVAARAREGVAITTDGAWRELDVDVPIEVIR